VCGPWGNGGRLAGWGSQGARPARRGKGQAVGIRQWRGIDVKKMLQNVGDGLATTSSQVYTQSTYHCALCINTILIIITRIMFYCNYCFRRINHLVVKKHLHSSSGVRAVLSSTTTKNGGSDMSISTLKVINHCSNTFTRRQFPQWI
jgi:hypothetical protein